MKKKKDLAYSKKLISDIRALLWVVTVGGILLAFYCVSKNFIGSLPWIGAMVGLPWAAHATVCSLYLKKSQAENTAADGTGIVYAAAAAKDFMEEYEKNKEKYAQGINSYVEQTYEETYEEEEVFLDDYYEDSPPI